MTHLMDSRRGPPKSIHYDIIEGDLYYFVTMDNTALPDLQCWLVDGARSLAIQIQDPYTNWSEAWWLVPELRVAA
jgi:hypothetical protein